MNTTELKKTHYELNKENILKNQPYKFGELKKKDEHAQKDLSRLVKVRDSILKDSIFSGEDHIMEVREQLIKHSEEINRFFSDHNKEIIELRSVKYQQLQNKDKKKHNRKCKKLFKKFRNCIGDYGLVYGKTITEIKVRADDLNCCIDIQTTMKVLSGIDDDIRLKKNSNNMSPVELDEKINLFFEHAMFPSKSKEFLKRTKRQDGENHYVIVENLIAYIKFSEGHKIGIDERINAFKQKMQLGADKVEQAIYQKYDEIFDEYAKLTVQPDEETLDDSLYHACQEANLDRLFHFCWKLHEHQKQKPFFSREKWNLIFKFMDLKRGKFINQKDLNEFLKSSSINELRIIKFEALEGGDAENHKFQNPMIVTEKRFGNGAACVSKIMNIGQLLNSRNDEKIEIVCEFYKNEKSLFDVHVPNKNYNYFMTRVTFWFFHSILKGIIYASDWSGDVVGNALNCIFTAMD